jgi:hypothetical protein
VRAETVLDPPGEDRGDGRGTFRVQCQAGFGAALGGFVGHGAGGFGEQVGQSAVTRDADVRELFIRAAVATCLGGQAAGGDCVLGKNPEIGGEDGAAGVGVGDQPP